MKIFVLLICLSVSLNLQCQNNGLTSKVNSNGYKNVDYLKYYEYNKWPQWQINVLQSPKKTYSIAINYKLDPKTKTICFTQGKSRLTIALSDGEIMNFELASKTACNKEDRLIFPLIQYTELETRDGTNYNEYDHKRVSLKNLKLLGSKEWTSITIDNENEKFILKPNEANIDNANKYFVHALRTLTKIDNTKGLKYHFEINRKNLMGSTHDWSLLGKGIGIYMLAGKEYKNVSDEQINIMFQNTFKESKIKIPVRVFVKRTDYNSSLFLSYVDGSAIGIKSVIKDFNQNLKLAIEEYRRNRE